ncbi:MAG: PTS sugar transporter subunit IIC [Clostridium sp.]|nr:PTS sugar transporter subunit IIC [Clostridium sp.]
MLIKAVLCGLITTFGHMENKFFGNSLLNRPLVICPLIGLVFGDLYTACVIGGTLEFVWMGIMYINVSQPADVCSGAAIGTAFALMTGSSTEVALAISIPVGLLTAYIIQLIEVIATLLLPKVDKYAAAGNLEGINRIHVGIGLGQSFFLGVVVIISMLVGANVIEGVVNAIPEQIMNGMSIASGILPAIGFAMLMNVMWDKVYVPFFFIGFVAYICLGLDITAITVIAAGIGVFKYLYSEGE